MDAPSPSEKNPILEIVVGTYEEFIIGYHLFQEEETFKLKQSFTSHSHTGSVRCAATSYRYLATGSSDESIKLVNLTSRKEVGSLMQHDGTITSLQFYKNSHLFSGSEDGTICVWRVRDWACLKTLKTKNAGVKSLSVHPSGKLLLSVSQDKALRTWNLIKGRTAYVTNIKAVSELVRWSPSGKYFAVGIGLKLDIYDVQTAGVIYTIEFGSKVNTLAFLTDEIVFVGGDSNDIGIFNIEKKKEISKFTAHENRVKDMVFIPSPVDDDRNIKWFVSISSDSFVKIWEVDSRLKQTPVLKASINTTCRLICLAICNYRGLKSTKDDEENEEILSEMVQTKRKVDVPERNDVSSPSTSNKRKKLRKKRVNK